MDYDQDPLEVVEAQTALPEEMGSPEPLANAHSRGQRRRQTETGSRSKKRCVNCRKAKKKCKRSVRGETCDRCKTYRKTDCGRDLTHEQYKALQGNGRTSLRSSSSAGPDSIPRGPRRSFQRTANRSESRSSSESVDSVQSSSSEGCNMFSRTPPQSNPQAWWLQKLRGLLNTKQQFDEMSGISLSFEVADEFASNPHQRAISSHNVATNQIDKEIKVALNNLHDLAVEASRKEQIVTAEWIFLQLFDVVRDLHDLRLSSRIKFLDGMASHYAKTKDHRQVWQISKILLALPFEPKHLDTMSKAQMRMAQSILDAAPVISSAFARELPRDIGPPIGYPPLHQALRFGDRGVLNIILKKTCEQEVSQTGRPLLLPNANDFPMSQRTEGLDVPDTWGRTPLFLAVELKDEDSCCKLLNAGACIDFKDCAGHSLLEIAASSGLFDTVKRILSIANASGPGSLNRHLNPWRWFNTSTPLQAAAAAGHLEIVLLLLSNGARSDTQRMPDHKTAAQLATDNGDIEVAAAIENWPTANVSEFR